MVTLVTYGPFTLQGECFLTSGDTEALTFLETSQNNSSIYDQYQDPDPDDLGVNQFLAVGKPAVGQQSHPDMEMSGPTDFASQDGADFATAMLGTGTFLGSEGGATEPACTFFGFVDEYPG